VEESTSSLTSVDAQVDSVARVISFFEAGASALRKAARPQGARALQSQLPGRLATEVDTGEPLEGGHAAAPASDAQRAAPASRRTAGLSKKQVNWEEF
jgi:hypothetical protein